jgi:hypothetical protein
MGGRFGKFDSDKLVCSVQAVWLGLSSDDGDSNWHTWNCSMRMFWKWADRLASMTIGSRKFLSVRFATCAWPTLINFGMGEVRKAVLIIRFLGCPKMLHYLRLELNINSDSLSI